MSEEFHNPYLNNTHRSNYLTVQRDQRTYMGILNFRASTPVEVILGKDPLITRLSQWLRKNLATLKRAI